MEQPGYEKRGYLREDFRLFHLTASMTETVGWHYHAFHKLCVYLGGDAIRYGIEGRSYALEPGDMILVPQGCVHRPRPRSERRMDRMLLYLSPEYLRSISTEETALETCFLQAAEEFHFVIRTGRRNGRFLSRFSRWSGRLQGPASVRQCSNRRWWRRSSSASRAACRSRCCPLRVRARPTRRSRRSCNIWPVI